MDEIGENFGKGDKDKITEMKAGMGNDEVGGIDDKLVE